MEIVLQWLDELDDLVSAGLALGRRLWFMALAAACAAGIGISSLYWLTLA